MAVKMMIDLGEFARRKECRLSDQLRRRPLGLMIAKSSHDGWPPAGNHGARETDQMSFTSRRFAVRLSMIDVILDYGVSRLNEKMRAASAGPQTQSPEYSVPLDGIHIERLQMR